jgi:hypothetical protein
MIRGKKGLLDDFFDLLFMVIGAFFIFIFISAVLLGSVKKSNVQSLESYSDIKRLESGVNNIRVKVYDNEYIKANQIDKMVKESKVLGGYIISICQDYRSETDCINDAAGVSGKTCSWINDQCTRVMH